jgi:hypothetical protein
LINYPSPAEKNALIDDSYNVNWKNHETDSSKY